jgi:hypothetical protein
MFKYLLGVLALVVIVLLWMSFWVGVPTITQFDPPAALAPHLVHDEARSIEKIGIAAFYFVPKNKVSDVTPQWKDIIERNLEQLRRFHVLQFRGLSDISYVVYPERIIGLEESLFYDTENTDRGNPYALINAAEELERRVFAKDGDLYRDAFVQELNDTYPVMVIMYEGVGATGGVIHPARDQEQRVVGASRVMAESEESSRNARTEISNGVNESEHELLKKIVEDLGLSSSALFEVAVDSVDGFFLVNRRFLEGEYGQFGASIFAHEFYHTLGTTDQYEGEHALPVSQDIMGVGRFRPLEKTYLERATLKQFGL